jgi:hypothetical protein
MSHYPRALVNRVEETPANGIAGRELSLLRLARIVPASGDRRSHAASTNDDPLPTFLTERDDQSTDGGRFPKTFVSCRAAGKAAGADARRRRVDAAT